MAHADIKYEQALKKDSNEEELNDLKIDMTRSQLQLLAGEKFC